MKRIMLVSILALFWAFSGLLVGLSLRALFGVEWVIPCASLNAITGLLLLLITTRSEEAYKIFYEGIDSQGQGLFLAFLWAIPFALAFLGLLWWALAQFGALSLSGNWRPAATLWLFPPLLLLIWFMNMLLSQLQDQHAPK